MSLEELFSDHASDNSLSEYSDTSDEDEIEEINKNVRSLEANIEKIESNIERMEADMYVLARGIRSIRDNLAQDKIKTSLDIQKLKRQNNYLFFTCICFSLSLGIIFFMI